MRYWTWGEVKEKIEADLDLLEEPDILAPNELLGYLNDAIDTVEQHFIKLGDYFLAVADRITLVDGQSDYDLPTDIYATKIRQILCSNNYVLRQLKDIKRIPDANESNGDSYRYMLINSLGTFSRPVIRLFPTPLKGDGEFIDIYYTRNAKRITSDDGDEQEIDVPEAMLYIICFIKMRIYEKEKNMAMYQAYREELMVHEKNLVDALAARIDDEDNVIEPDMDIYKDMLYV
jgi:hypothetical protein